MGEHENEPPSKRRLEKKSGRSIILPILLACLFILATLYLLFPEAVKQFRPSSLKALVGEQIPPTGSEPYISGESQALDGVNIPASTTTSSDPPGEQPQATEMNEADNAGSSSQDSQINPSQNSNSGECKADEVGQQLANTVEAFFNTLDSRAYIHDFAIDQKSSVYFPQLIQRLVDNPPVVTGETNDLFTILKNTAHFFRIIGKRNIIILKGIIDREKATFEKTLSDFFQLTTHPDCLKERFGLTINTESIYQYSGFFLNTMGGRLYLFRRDSMSRMVVNYYAILVVDQANREGRNKYGLQLTDAIDSLIDDIETSSAKLDMRDIYLDSLYNMKEKYQ